MLHESNTKADDLLKQAEAILVPWIPEEAIQELDEESPLMLNYTERRIKLTGNGRSDCLDVSISADELLTVIETLLDNGWGYLATITGVDLGVESGEIEVLYHFCHGAAVVTLSVKVSRENPVVPTVCGLIPSASFYERELFEMLGVTITNTPNTDHLFLPDNWPDGVYPLRKDFQMPSAN
jgi:NADH:ubiquinone oxidoreductase subunit C